MPGRPREGVSSAAPTGYPQSVALSPDPRLDSDAAEEKVWIPQVAGTDCVASHLPEVRSEHPRKGYPPGPRWLAFGSTRSGGSGDPCPARRSAHHGSPSEGLLLVTRDT